MRPTPYDFTFYVGADYAYKIDVNFTDGTSLSNYTVVALLTKGLTGPVAATLGVQVSDNSILVSLPNSISSRLTNIAYNHYVKLTRNDGYVIPIVIGTATGLQL